MSSSKLTHSHSVIDVPLDPIGFANMLPCRSQSLTIAAAEPELPPLSHKPATQPTPTLARKRTIDSVLYSNSSDPPLFSSDDASVSLDNYDKPRRKKLYTGSWWSNSQEDGTRDRTSEKPRKRAFKWNYDSGIWMGSDDSNGADTDLASEEELGRLPLQPVQTAISTKQGHMSRTVKPAQAFTLTSKQREALKIVQHCAEIGQEDVDLSRVELDHIPWPVLESMKYITRVPSSSGTFINFEPNLRLYLAHNNLVEIPSQIFNIENLTILSLRNNNLSELSPFISRLMNLEDLNLSSNAFRYLPHEILKLISLKLRILRLEPNPFYEPVIETKESSPSLIETIRNPSSSPTCRAISRIAYLDIRGLPTPGSIPPSSGASASLPKGTQSAISVEPDQRIKSSSGASSLYEHALRFCTQLPHPDHLAELFPDDGTPDHILQGLKGVVAAKTAGWQRCSVCNRGYIVHRTEWLEWWTGLPSNRGLSVPLLRKGCSWKCLPSLEDLDEGEGECGWK